MVDRDKELLLNILYCCEDVFSFVKRFGGYKEYINDMAYFNAVNKSIESIGEFANNLSEEFCSEHSDIPWKKLVGTRNQLVHNYCNADDEILWNTIKNDIPYLHKYISAILDPIIIEQSKAKKESVLKRLKTAQEIVKQQKSQSKPKSRENEIR